MASIINAGASGLTWYSDSSGALKLQIGGVDFLAVDAAGVVTFLSAEDVTTYMATSILLNGSAALCNTGSIGKAGQKWEITGVALIGCTDATSTVAGVSIYDGSTHIARGGGVGGWGVANWPTTSMCRAVATLAGPTTFTLYGTGNPGNTYAFQNGYGLGTTATACFISARRLK